MNIFLESNFDCEAQREMANTQVFSPNLLGKRSAHFDTEEDEMNYEGDNQSHSNHVIKKFKLASKPTQMVNSYNPAHSNLLHSGMNDDCGSPPSKMARRSDENSLNQTCNNFNAELQELRYQNSQWATKYHQAEITLSERNQAIVEQKNFNNRLLEELQKRTSERDSVVEENRILKKGIAYQETKIKELNSQIQQYEQFILAAKAYIEEAEREKQLKVQSTSLNFPRNDFFPPRPPPDVF